MQHVGPAFVVGCGLVLFGCASDDTVAPDGGAPVDVTDGAVDDAGAVLPASFIVGLALNDAIDDRAPRGWPMLLMGIAALVDDTTTGVLLDTSSLELVIENSTGAPEVWPLEALTPLDGPVVLDDTREQVDVTWALTAAQTQALPLGRRTAHVRWAGEVSPSIDIDVVDLEASTDANVLATRAHQLATLEARAALLRGDPNGALAALETALANSPDDIALLVWQGKAYDALGATTDALASLDHAAAIVATATSAEPAVTVYENRRPILDRFIGGAP